MRRNTAAAYCALRPCLRQDYFFALCNHTNSGLKRLTLILLNMRVNSDPTRVGRNNEVYYAE